MPLSNGCERHFILGQGLVHFALLAFDQLFEACQAANTRAKESAGEDGLERAGEQLGKLSEPADALQRDDGSGFGVILPAEDGLQAKEVAELVEHQMMAGDVLGDLTGEVGWKTKNAAAKSYLSAQDDGTGGLTDHFANTAVPKWEGIGIGAELGHLPAGGIDKDMVRYIEHRGRLYTRIFYEFAAWFNSRVSACASSGLWWYCAGVFCKSSISQ